MSTFITDADYLVHIKDVRLQQMIEGNAILLTNAEDTAIAEITDALYSRYDTEYLFALTGEARPKQLVRWVLNIALYYLHERLPERLIPDRVLKNYDETKKYLGEIEDGKKSTNLRRLEQTDGAQTDAGTKFKWGSRPARTH